MSTIKLSEQFSLYRSGGDTMDSYIQNICNYCGWHGTKHKAYNNYQHSNCQDERERHVKHFCANKPNEE